MRGDDAAGPEVARLVAAHRPAATVLEHETEPTGLIVLWEEAPLAIVVDALAPAGHPGRIERFEVGPDGLPPEPRRPVSTHAYDLAATVELARVLGRLPRRLLVVGVEAESFAPGAPRAPAVVAACEAATERVLRELSRPPVPATAAPR